MRNNAGIMAVAALKLGVTRSTVCRFVQKHQKLQLVINEVTEEMTDLAEGNLMKAIREGKEWAVKYWLSERGQSRGFGARKLAFKDQDGTIQVPAMLVTQAIMTPSEWEAQYGNGGKPVAQDDAAAA